MIGDNSRTPKINAMNDFAIFAMPSKRIIQDGVLLAELPKTSPNDSPPKRPAEVASNVGLDATPTGSLPPAHKPGVSSNEIISPIAPSYRILDVNDGQAFLETEFGFRHVRAGDALPGLGVVKSIAKRDGSYAIVTENGTIVQNIGGGKSGAASTKKPQHIGRSR